ncbi:MAG: hypothetical protein IR158_13110 [Cellulomonas sp.]|uniref:DUF7832 domain-containing protein n=1 Tax=Cellulomonas sp. TaxID=40001 RepID=UPI001A05287E|nr:hypothetical protein [Cellulomonas sp.]MBF0688689.1 hypothetical protein [Cellulomonas sp.]
MGDDTGATVYDKAKWHYEGEFPRWTRRRQAFVHTGFFLAWVVQRGMAGEMLVRESPDGIAAVRERRGRPDDLYAAWDGVLTSEMLDDEANAFARTYYEGDVYVADFIAAFPHTGAYKVRSSWENYDRVAAVLDERLAAWRAQRDG